MYSRSKYLVSILFVLFTAIQGCFCRESFVVVLDAGHGGKDPGAVYAGIKEKDINLSVALMVGGMLRDSCPDIKVVYTRKSDEFIELSKRTEISNSSHADIFISIHANASKNSGTSGIETYVMGMEKSTENLQVAMRENSVITQEIDYSERYEGYDPSSSESFIIFNLQQHSFQVESINFATELQKVYGSQFPANMPDRGIRQANFLVLWKTSSPSVLTEIGFVSNQRDRAFISSKNGQTKIARAIFSAVRSLYDASEKKSGAEVVKQVMDVVAEPHAEDTVKAVPAVIKPQEGGRAVSSGIEYKIQLLSLSRPIPITPSNFHEWCDSIECLFDGKLFKYFHKGTNVYQEILTLQDSLRVKFPDCFVVAFKGDRQISVSEARLLESK